MGIWRAPHPPPYLKSRALRGGFLKSWASQGRILYPKPWILQGGFLEKLSGIKGGGYCFLPSSPLPSSLGLSPPITPYTPGYVFSATYGVASSTLWHLNIPTSGTVCKWSFSSTAIAKTASEMIQKVEFPLET